MGKVTKTEIFLLVLTLLFAAAAAALFFTGRPRSEGYTVTTQRDDAGPQEPQSGPLNINTATGRKRALNSPLATADSIPCADMEETPGGNSLCMASAGPVCALAHAHSPAQSSAAEGNAAR